MEVGYVNHQSASLPSTASDGGPLYDAQTTSVSMTATMDISGNLILGIVSIFILFLDPLSMSVRGHLLGGSEFF